MITMTRTTQKPNDVEIKGHAKELWLYTWPLEAIDGVPQYGSFSLRFYEGKKHAYCLVEGHGFRATGRVVREIEDSTYDEMLLAAAFAAFAQGGFYFSQPELPTLSRRHLEMACRAIIPTLAEPPTGDFPLYAFSL